MLIDLATHGLFTEGLGPEAVVVDLGANHGDFSRQVKERFGCTVVAVEPSKGPYEHLLTVPGIIAVCAAVGKSDGTVDFHVCENSQMSSLHPIEGARYERVEQVKMIGFESLLRQHSLQRVDVLKIDIEGSEVGLLDSISDERLASIGQITIELHDFNGMITEADADAIESRLGGLGFHRIQLSRSNRENVLFFNTKRCGISPIAETWSRLFTRNVIGIKRNLNRRRVARNVDVARG